MDSRHKISIPIIIACLLLTVISSFLFYNIGYNKACTKKSRPIYVKYSNFTSESLEKAFERSKIVASPSQIETFGKRIKEGGNSAR